MLEYLVVGPRESFDIFESTLLQFLSLQIGFYIALDDILSESLLTTLEDLYKDLTEVGEPGV